MMQRPMRVVQAAAWYPPHGLGGTEVYLEGLVEALAACGIGGSVLVPRHALGEERYTHRGVGVETYPVGEAASDRDLGRRQPHAGFEAFVASLTALRRTADIYHQHSWTRGCGLAHLEAARALGFRTVVTVHVPSAICLRGTMMRTGRIPCDGRIEASRCGGCYLESRGLPPPLSALIAALPDCIAQRAAATRGRRIATALATPALAMAKHEQLRALSDSADAVVAVCQWLYDALVGNGVPTDKLCLSRQGLPVAFADALSLAGRLRSTSPHEPLRLLLLGRSDPVKGMELVMRAVLALPQTCDVRLTVHAVSASDEEKAHRAHLQRLVAGDPRIDLRCPAQRSELPAIFARHDVLAVPSLCLETGPLVVLEAQAAGMFVLGSHMGGIGELMHGSPSGRLLDPHAPSAWSGAIADLAQRHVAGGLARFACNVRTMDAVARDMAALYQKLWRRENSCEARGSPERTNWLAHRPFPASSRTVDNNATFD